MDAMNVAALFPYYRAEDWRKMENGWLVATTTLDKNREDFAGLIGYDVLIAPTHDGTDRLYEVIGVERFSHYPPWRSGERIGLAVKPLDE